MKLFKPGDVVTVLCLADEEVNYSSWFRGPVIKTLSVGNGYAVHVVEPKDYKPADEPWRPYDGIPRVIARQRRFTGTLLYIDNWPRSTRYGRPV